MKSRKLEGTLESEQAQVVSGVHGSRVKRDGVDGGVGRVICPMV